jgi:hypothetical protein
MAHRKLGKGEEVPGWVRHCKGRVLCGKNKQLYVCFFATPAVNQASSVTRAIGMIYAA